MRLKERKGKNKREKERGKENKEGKMGEEKAKKQTSGPMTKCTQRYFSNLLGLYQQTSPFLHHSLKQCFAQQLLQG